MNGSTRLFSLFSPPPSLILRRRFSGSSTTPRCFHRCPCSLSNACSSNHHSLRLSASVSSPLIIPTVIPLRRLRTYRARFSASDSVPLFHHSWPEWSELLRVLSEAGYFSDTLSASCDENEFASSFPVELLVPARACLALARDQPNLLAMVSRRNVQVLVENGTPFLFKKGEDSIRKMRHYLSSVGHDTGNILDMDKATTLDLMRYLLSYIGYLAASEKNDHHGQEVTVLSVRSLLSEITKLSSSTSESNVYGTLQNERRDRHEQAPSSVQQTIKMKRGDWICPRCNCLNFAKNVNCFECEEARPKRQLTGREWECPQCDFYNYGRNTVCLRCDCKRPGSVLLNEFTPNNPEQERRLAENEEEAQRWFSKVSQLEKNSETNSALADEDFPEIMPLRKGVNRFVVSSRKIPLERRLSNSENRVDTGSYGARNENKTLGTKTTMSSDEILGSSSYTDSRSDDKYVSSRQFGSSRVSDSDFVPFVPLPADMFAKKPEKLNTEETQMGLPDNDQSISENNESVGRMDSSKLSGKQIVQLEKQEKEEKEELEEKSARWFKRVTELQGVSDLDKIPDEDFPDIMPMRKGDNRFVVSKKKDRSLTSPAYKRRMAMEQAKDSNFVPFVPFPPDYFAKKEQPETVAPIPEVSGEISVPTTDSSNKIASQVEQSMPSNQIPTASETSESHSFNSAEGNVEDRKGRSSWSGKSLEGSLVKELDSLDMSEEAKAERWFRRVAQIKNISELSQIPDEDFPSIMPMRKGVNRFVVSKRKTPLERRLASQQHRRKSPPTDSDLPQTGDS